MHVTGFSDYVSKEWQRNYVCMIFLFALDLVLYKLGWSRLRFTRPIRLCVVAGRHRDVRRLVSTIPKMCARLLTTFAIPLLASLGFFAIIVHRFYGSLPEDMQPDLGNDDFGDVLSCMRSLFVLSTLSNFDPVVVQTFRLHKFSAVPFMMFLLFCGFFLMSVALVFFVPSSLPLVSCTTVLLQIDFVVTLLLSHCEMSKDVCKNKHEKKSAGSVDTGKRFAL